MLILSAMGQWVRNFIVVPRKVVLMPSNPSQISLVASAYPILTSTQASQLPVRARITADALVFNSRCVLGPLMIERPH